MHLHANLNVQVDILNDDHVHLMEVVNLLADLHRANLVLTGELENLLQLTRNHFTREEELLKKVEYPERHSHSMRHYNILAEMKAMVAAYDCNNSAATAKLLFSLKCCLMDLLLDDLEYVNHVRQMGMADSRSLEALPVAP
jgi:methyl-accepting chemotaxis protein